MQSEAKDIYKITSVRTGASEQLYKDLGNFVLKAVHENLDKPKSLITKLKGVGYWFLKRKRMMEVMKMYPDYYEIEGYNDFQSERAFLNFVNKQEIYKIFKARLLDYEDYLKTKAETKIKKDEFKRLFKEQKDSPSTSEDNG